MAHRREYTVCMWVYFYRGRLYRVGLVFTSGRGQGREEAQLKSEVDVPSGLLSEGGRCHVSCRVQGWVSEFTSDRARILEPMGRYCWQTWGRVRLYTTLCGHAVHHDCWDAFYASVLQQARQHSPQ